MARNRWLILAVLFLARTSMGYQFQSVASLSPFLMADLAIDYTMLGALVGLYLLPGIVIALPGGLLGKRFGDKRVVIWGLGLMVLGGVLTGLGTTYTVVVCGRVLGGVGAVLLNVLLAKMVTDWFVGKEIIMAMAILLNSWPLGIGLALVTQGAMAASYSWTLVFHVTAAVCAFALLLVAVAYRAPPSVAANGGGASLFAISGRELWLVSLAGLIWTLFNVGYIIVVSFAPALLVALGAPVAEAGLIVSFATWSIIVSVPLGGFLVERLGRPNLAMVAGFLAMGGAMAILPFSPSALLTVVFVGIVAGLPVGAIMALPTEVLSAANRGPGLGIFFTWYYAGMAVLPPLAGLTRDLTGDPAAPLFFGAAVTVLSIPVLGLFRVYQARLVRP